MVSQNAAGRVNVRVVVFSGHQVFNVIVGVERLDLVPVELHEFTVFVKQKLGKVPLDLFAGRGLRLCEKFVRIVTFHRDFLHERELDAILGSYPLFDLRFGPGLLRSELVAGESQNLKLAIVLRMHLVHLAVVLVSEASLARHVDNEASLTAGQVV